MISILCCDDNETHLSGLIRQIADLPQSEYFNVMCFTTSAELIGCTDENTDIIICDILLDNENGIAVMQKIKQRFPHIQVIFVSSYLAYCEDIYNIEHISFIKKPVAFEKLETALHKATEIINKEKSNYLTIRNKKISATVHMSKILYLESVAKQLNIVTEDEFYAVSVRTDEVLELLDSSFIQCNKSFTVNMNKIRTFEKAFLTLCDGKKVPITPSRYTSIKQQYLRFLGEKI